MIIDPHIAVIRTRPSLDFYDRVIARVFARDERPRGVLLHYAAIYRDELHVCTAFTDRVAMQETFVGFSSLEAQNEMVASGETLDLDRTEYELERLQVWPAVEANRYWAAGGGSLVAVTSEPIALTPEEYRQIEQRRDWGNMKVPGRLAHVAFRRGESMYTTTFWADRASAEAFYNEMQRNRDQSGFPAREGPGSFDDGIMEVHALVVTLPEQDPIRNYRREHTGPSATDD